MVVNRLQKGLINSCKGFNGKLSKYFFFKCEHILFLSNSDRDFYSGNKNVLQVYTYITKIRKKKLKNAFIVYTIHLALNIGAIFAQSLCFYLSFVFPANLIWLLHCIPSFLLGARHLFQKLVSFFLCEVIQDEQQ
jgi:hypothetical protein